MIKKLVSGDYLAFRTFVYLGQNEIFRVDKLGKYSGFVLPVSYHPVLNHFEGKLSNLSLSIEYLGFDEQPASYYLHIAPMPGVDLDIFETFLQSCFAEFNGDYELNSVFSVLESQFSKWSFFFGGSGGGSMSLSRNIGLFGELWFLMELVKAHGPDSISSWWGPFQNHNDFEFSKRVIEIKSTVIMGKNRISVNGASQFQDEYGRRVNLLFLLLAPNSTAPNISKLLKELVSLGVSESELINRVSRIGDIEEIRLSSEQMHLSSVSGRLYEVDEHFPLIRAATLPPQVSGLSYQISLDGLPFREYSGPLALDLG